MNVRVSNLKVPFKYTLSDIEKALLKKYKWTRLKAIKVVRRSLDARSQDLCFVLSVDVTLFDPIDISTYKDVSVVENQTITIPKVFQPKKVIVVGAGPAGLMATYHLAKAGCKPLLIERGQKADTRAKQVDAFWKTGTLDNESNVLFGEGGAGLFSDGKLTSRSKDRPRVNYFFETLVACGAHPDILIDAEPHLGSDQLLKIIAKLREQIKEFGGEVRFGAKLDRLEITDNQLKGVYVNDELIQADAVVLATGHSAHDVYQVLNNLKIAMASKPFAIGVRAEMPQHAVDRSQWGKWARNDILPAASFRLTRKPEKQFRACYSFCMCPGGLVISCASKQGELFTNGMSYSKRSSDFANAAFLVPVIAADYTRYGNDALAGIAFQQAIEQKAYAVSKGTYQLPAMTLSDFMHHNRPKQLLDNRSWKQAIPYNLYDLLPAFVTATLKEAIPKMLKKLSYVNKNDVLLYGPETRSSSPIRIDRDRFGESTNVKGLYPCGEGAGYAGGIVSSAVDGLRIAESILTSVS